MFQIRLGMCYTTACQDLTVDKSSETFSYTINFKDINPQINSFFLFSSIIGVTISFDRGMYSVGENDGSANLSLTPRCLTHRSII